MKLSDKAKSIIRTAYNVLISLMLVALGILFAYQSYLIYKSGPSPFTRASIGEAFSRISAVVYVTLSLIILGAAIHIAIPKDKEKLKGSRSASVLVSTLAGRVDVDKLPMELSEKISRERKLRSVLYYVRIGLIILESTLPLIYLLNPANFPAKSGEYNAEILHGMLLYLVFLAPLAIYEVVYVLIRDASLHREHAALKEAVKLVGITDAPIEEPVSKIARIRDFLVENKKPITLGVRIAFVGCAIGFIIAGVLNGGMEDVLNKAINICTECIGLG